MTEIKTIVSLGPATNGPEMLRMMRCRGVHFVRINMSHSSVDDLRHFIALANEASIPFIIDTEGSQVRTGEFSSSPLALGEGESVRIRAEHATGCGTDIPLRPDKVIESLCEGDLVKLGFDTLMLRVSDASTVNRGFVTTKVITAGSAAQNKAVVIDTGTRREFTLPPLSDKDYEAIRIGREEAIGHIAVSFVRKPADIQHVREISGGTMKVIAKIECREALEHLDEIIAETDYLLLDRGDLSNEIPIERIPFAQKTILNRANRLGKGVFVATNLLESMIAEPRPTQAEVNDVVNTILDGAEGLILAAETAIGDHPIGCINMLNKIITHTNMVIERREPSEKEGITGIEAVEPETYLLSTISSGGLIEPHGGKLVDRTLKHLPTAEELNGLCEIQIDDELFMDVEQIAIGAFSPLDGFLKEEELSCVLDNMTLPGGVVWTAPIVLEITETTADRIDVGDRVILRHDDIDVAIMHVEDKYRFDRREFAAKSLDTVDNESHRVGIAQVLKPVFLGGKIDLINRRQSPYKEYELTPRQTRRLFDERGWNRVAGFHTDSVVHRNDEFLQLEGMKYSSCDGLLVHPVVGRKNLGHYTTEYVIRTYEAMQRHFYPRGRVVVSIFATVSRWSGHREAVFNVICRKNFGCSHFIVGSDHRGDGEAHSRFASHEILDRFDSLGIEIIRLRDVVFSQELNADVLDTDEEVANKHCAPSGTEARAMILAGEMPPEWLMRPEISEIVLSGVRSGERVFID